MDKFQTELLAQLKEHNRLTKELVKIEQANFELSKDINKVNSSLADVIIPHNLGTYCGVDASVIDIHANRSISDFIPGEPKPAYWKIDLDSVPDKVAHICSNCNWARYTYPDSILWKYCPNCGMKMSMEKEGEEDA